MSQRHDAAQSQIRNSSATTQPPPPLLFVQRKAPWVPAAVPGKNIACTGRLVWGNRRPQPRPGKMYKYAPLCSVLCSSFSLFRPNLGGNELGRRSARELAEAAGFRIEDHQATTADGFILVLHRLVDPDRVVSIHHSRSNCPGSTVRLPTSVQSALLSRAFVATKYCTFVQYRSLLLCAVAAAGLCGLSLRSVHHGQGLKARLKGFFRFSVSRPSLSLAAGFLPSLSLRHDSDLYDCSLEGWNQRQAQRQQQRPRSS